MFSTLFFKDLQPSIRQDYKNKRKNNLNNDMNFYCKNKLIYKH